MLCLCPQHFYRFYLFLFLIEISPFNLNIYEHSTAWNVINFWSHQRVCEPSENELEQVSTYNGKYFNFLTRDAVWQWQIFDAMYFCFFSHYGCLDSWTFNYVLLFTLIGQTTVKIMPDKKKTENKKFPINTYKCPNGCNWQYYTTKNWILKPVTATDKV